MGENLCSNTGRKCNEETDYHTDSCRSRHALAEDIVEYLRDEVETRLRERLTQEWGALTLRRVAALYMSWTRSRDLQMSISEADSNILAHRFMTDVGSFRRCYLLAEQVRAFEIAEEAAQRKIA